MVSTLAMVGHGELGELRTASGRYKQRDKVGRKLNRLVDHDESADLKVMQALWEVNVSVGLRPSFA